MPDVSVRSRTYAASPLSVRAPFVRAVIATLSMIALLSPSVARAGVFDVGTMKADRGEVILDANVPAAVPASPMLQQIAGVRAVLTSRDLSQLRACVLQDPRVPLPERASRVALIRLGAARRTGLVEIFQLQDGTTLARELDPAAKEPVSLAAKLRPDGWNKVARTLALYRGGLSADALAEHPLDAIEVGKVWPAPWIIDGDEIDRRFTGKQSDRAPASRDLSLERFAIHVGPGITARQPASLLVWLSPMANATIPTSLADAASKQGFIVIAPTDAGGSRDLTNRIQVTLDAAYAAQERWHIDPNRVYVGGFSAGAGLANLVWMAFPDVFSGTLLVGSASFYQEVQAGPAAYWPRQFNEPSAANMKLLVGKRAAAIVGEADPSRPHVVAVAKRMALESIRAESFIVPKIGHEIPHEDYFVRAFQWIEADATAEWDARCETGAKLLDAADKLRDASARQRALVAVTREAPWTPAAWRAVEMLNEPQEAK